MCGFAGEFLLGPGRADPETARRMAAAVAHRGPDERGEFFSSDGRCAVAFHRLAIIDPAGSHQPMTSADGNTTVAFNGVIYNFRALRQQLAAQGAVFRTNGDTEVLLHLYARRGEKMLHDLEGMFAFAIYDAARGELFLARDRLGEKPLWYAPLTGRIIFASQAKALLRHPMLSAQPDNEAITHYLTIGYVPSDLSAFSGLKKLPPGAFLKVSDTVGPITRYWEPAGVEAPGQRGQQCQLVRETVTKAVESRLVSDVPLGVLLSGGMDSSIVAAVMAQAAGKTGGVRTFTAGFKDKAFDERSTAALMAKHIGTDHTELLIDPLRPAMLDELVDMFDEPFGDSSALATWLICRAARNHVKVVLVGDGGDEAFGGYDRYRAIKLASTMGPITYLGIRTAGAMAEVIAPHHERNMLRRLARFARALPYPYSTQYVMYRRLFGPQELRMLLDPQFAEGIDVEAPARWFCDHYEAHDTEDEAARAQTHDIYTYLPDDLLVKSDTASMSVGLEMRAPMLDHRLVELGLSLPTAAKIGTRRGKIILREAFEDMLPAKVRKAGKRGFGVPVSEWLRKDLAETLRETLLDEALARRRIFRKEAVAALIQEHEEGRADHGQRLWALLMLARWLARRG